MVYLPPHFRETRPEVLAEIIERNSFATLVTHGPGGLIASQLPFLYDAAEGPHGTLLCHLARPNPQVADLNSATEALVIFAGPHSYVSPSWYETHPAVPTWNYATVHAYGHARAIEDPAALTRLVDRLAQVFESGRVNPWRLADQPEKYVAGMVRGIIGFSLPVSRLEGKFKLSQNRSATDRRRVAAALDAEGDPSARAVAALMTAHEHAGAGAE
jgi:transcriptional regulator